MTLGEARTDEKLTGKPNSASSEADIGDCGGCIGCRGRLGERRGDREGLSIESGASLLGVRPEYPVGFWGF